MFVIPATGAAVANGPGAVTRAPLQWRGSAVNLWSWTPQHSQALALDNIVDNNNNHNNNDNNDDMYVADSPLVPARCTRTGAR